MLEPEPDPTTSDREVEPLIVTTTTDHDLNLLIVSERNKEVKKIEEDVMHLSAAQRMLAKIAAEQGQQIDDMEINVSQASSILSAGNEALSESEKSANRRHKRNIILGVTGGVVALGVAGATTVSILKSQGKF